MLLSAKEAPRNCNDNANLQNVTFFVTKRTRSFLSTTFLSGKPKRRILHLYWRHREPCRFFASSRIVGRAKRSWRSRVWQIAGPAPRRVTELCPRRWTNEGVRGENATTDISAGLIGYLYAALVTWPLRKDAREPFVELSISGGFGSRATTPFGEALRVLVREKRRVRSPSLSLSFSSAQFCGVG